VRIWTRGSGAHETTEASLIGALGTINELNAVLEPPRLIRIETL
jgi:hypothetical protein